MDNDFTLRLKGWLDKDDAGRDYAEGARLLLQLNMNQVMFRTNMARISLPKTREFIAYQLQRYYNFRVQDLTHSEVVAMEKQVDRIVSKRLSVSSDNPADEFRAGKREDHDSLPEDIRQLYVDNAEIMHRMRDLNAKLRLLSTEDSPCPDSERYPFLKELIALDKKYHQNWNIYDHWPDAPV